MAAMTMGWARVETSPVIDRGPVCECDNPHCVRPLGITRLMAGSLTRKLHTALVVKGHEVVGDYTVVSDKGEFVVVRYA
jgi:hypothetical protein